ncbi:dynein assembly factor 1, axonemal [Selaginella moellendorffii]|uniref:dynein assembly factor 1, axonemal n=1 Tax=Selaginella moellendorffii TaxID=88036 RepID=UPI000D1C65B7|nr:dynein assembly factor 1, axonemal [Selaginella moellendorffii]|eukprot:XP_024525801.1 dynein assembly factor 1, axonemal [Selaginella moellendorffii]
MLDSSSSSGGEITKEWLRKHCRRLGLYVTPSLNDKLYLHYQGFGEIKNLEEYTGLKMLFLEGNFFESLDGLQPLAELRCLYVQKNQIACINHLEDLKMLDTLDLSNNCLKTLENLSACPSLKVLQVSNNYLKSVESIEHLKDCTSICVLDVSSNKLDDGEGVLGVLKAMPELTVLYLSGNPCVTNLQPYRKTVISSLPKLNHLDDRPVFWDERLCAEAWARGGYQAEQEERERVKAIRSEMEIKQLESMRKIRNDALEERARLEAVEAMEEEERSTKDAQVEACFQSRESTAVAEEVEEELETSGSECFTLDSDTENYNDIELTRSDEQRLGSDTPVTNEEMTETKEDERKDSSGTIENLSPETKEDEQKIFSKKSQDERVLNLNTREDEHTVSETKEEDEQKLSSAADAKDNSVC